LSLRAAQAAIAAAAHFARNDGRSQRMLGAPVGGVEGWIEEEAEDGIVLGREMPREAPRVGEATGSPRKQAAEAIDIGPAGDRESMIGYGARGEAIACGQRGAQERIDLRSKPMMGIVQPHRAAATKQMRQTRLMARVGKLAVGRPAIALQDAGVLGAEHPRGLREAAPVFDRVGRRARRRKGPEPVRVAADLPAGFIGRDSGTRAHLCAQRLVRRLRLARRAMHRVDEAPARHRQAKAIVQQRREAAEGEPALFIEDHRERDGLRAELHSGSAERSGGLQRMPPLHAPMTVSALADRNTKFVDHGPLRWQVFLILRNHAPPPHGAAAVRTVRGQRGLVHGIDLMRPRAMRLPTIGGARFASRSFGMRLRQAARKGRRLPVRAAPCHLQFLAQALVLAAQPIAFVLRPH